MTETKLTDTQLEWLSTKRQKDRIGYSAFLGMVYNQATSLAKEPLDLLGHAINYNIEVEQQLREYGERPVEMSEETVTFG